MSLAIQPSLFDPPATSRLAAAMDWITGALLGPLAVSLCVIAVASLGLAMLTGRLPLRRGLEVVLGCFVLLGAPVIASAFIGGAQREAVPLPPPPAPAEPARAELPPADYDPYAGASLRRD